MKNTFVITVAACAAVAMFVSRSAQGQAPAAPAAKPRGATAPPEQANVKPVNFLPNPYGSPTTSPLGSAPCKLNDDHARVASGQIQ